jgi:FkbM family methyltransferase
MAFDLSFPTQAFIYRILSKAQIADPPLVTALTEVLEPGDVFFDVGAHIGYYSLMALQNLGPTGSVYAFEPNHQTYGVLLANALHNRPANFYTCNCAVGDRTGTLQFNINADDEGMSSLLFRGKQSTEVSVHVTTLDLAASLAQIKKICMLKIDVEGYEENVIRGAAGLIAAGAIESIVFEINNGLPTVPKGRDLVIRSLLRQHGFTSYLIRPWLAEQQWQNAFGSSNYYRLPDDRPLEIRYGNILATRRPIKAAPMEAASV